MEFNAFNGVCSRHPGGVNTSFADGSVRFIKDSVNYKIWIALGFRLLPACITTSVISLSPPRAICTKSYSFGGIESSEILVVHKFK